MRSPKYVADVSVFSSSLRIASLLLWTAIVNRPVMVPSIVFETLAHGDLETGNWLYRLRAPYRVFPSLTILEKPTDSNARIGASESVRTGVALVEDIRASSFLLRHAFEKRLLV